MLRSLSSRPALRRVLLCAVLVLSGLAMARGSAPATAAAPAAQNPWWVSIPPARLLDTRAGQPTVDGQESGWGRLGPGASRPLPVGDRGGVPRTGVAAVVLNITATNASAGTYITVFPRDTPRPLASNLNLGPGQTVANLVVSPIDSIYRSVEIYNAAGLTDIVADVVGYAPFGAFGALPPTRLLDTRPGQPTFDGQFAGTGPVHAEGRQPVSVSQRLGAPGATAAVVNITTTDASAPTFVTAVAHGAPLPGTSNLNPQPGRITTNLAVIPLDADGFFDLYNYRGDIHLIADVVGYLHDAGNPSFNLLSPTRVLDTRTDGGPVTTNQSRLLDVRGRAGVPTTGVGAVVLNLTAVGPTTTTYITAYPSGKARPHSSNITPPVGMATANLVVVPLGADGRIALYNAAGSVDLVADIVGWIADPTGPGTPDDVWVFIASDIDIIQIIWNEPYPGGSAITGYDVAVEKDGVTTPVCQPGPVQYAVDCRFSQSFLPGPFRVSIRTNTSLGSSLLWVDPFQCNRQCPPAALGRKF